MADALVQVPLATLGLTPLGPVVPDGRWDRMRRRLRRLVPPPAADSGWLHCRQRAESEWIGVVQDSQNRTAESMLLEGAKMVRVDAQADRWDIPEYQWRMQPRAELGARGLWVDAWGEAMAVPRSEANENDSRYSIRILSELTRPATVNHGKAAVVDEALGVEGTIVLETQEYFIPYRFNERRRFNDPVARVRANWCAAFFENARWATFIVLLEDAPTDAQRALVAEIVARIKAAGTRMFAIYSVTGAPAPDPFSPTIPETAWLLVEDDSPFGTPTSTTVAQPWAEPDSLVLVDP